MRPGTFVSWFGILALAAAACGGDKSGGSTGGNAGTGGGGKVSPSACYKQCEAQTTVQGCTPIVGLADCKALCDGLVASTKAECADEFDAYYTCSANDGFACIGGLIAQKTNACMAAQDTFDKCRNGGTKSSCVGQRADGTCPSVQCPCKSGAKPVSGFDNSSGTCRCLDAKTCLDLFCD